MRAEQMAKFQLQNPFDIVEFRFYKLAPPGSNNGFLEEAEPLFGLGRDVVEVFVRTQCVLKTVAGDVDPKFRTRWFFTYAA